MDKMLMQGKVAMVTGGGRGIGEASARRLADFGAKVILADLDLASATAVAESLKSEGKEADAIEFNVADFDHITEKVAAARAIYGRIDVLVNVAGITGSTPITDITHESWDRMMDIDLKSLFFVSQAVFEVMKEQGYGKMVHMSSLAALRGGRSSDASYACAKAGILNLSKCFALAGAPFHITSNAVCPGNFLDGPLWSDPEKGLFVQYLKAGKVPGAKTVADVRAFYEAKVPLGRGCRIEDVAKAVLYIIDQKYETGQAVPVTGGQEMLK